MSMLLCRDLVPLGAAMAKPSREVEFPLNLFNTWLDYRESLGQSRADVIREMNEVLDRKYDNDRFYKWKKQLLTVPEHVILSFIEPELPEALKHLFKVYGMPTRGIDFDFLAESVKPPVKDIRD